MKKIIFSILLIAASLVSFDSKAQSKTKYYYYPSENVYFNTTTRQYGYMGGNNQWTWGTLPSSLAIADTNRYVALYSPNDEIWKQNETHKMKYKNGQVKKIKAKTKD
jgi:hypothetical protein